MAEFLQNGMENIYLGQYEENYPRLWHSDNIELSKYFDHYSKEVNKYVKNGKFNFNSVLKSVLPDSISLNREMFETLKKLTCIDQLKPKVKIPQLKKKYKYKKNTVKMQQLEKEGTFPFGERERSIMGFGLKEGSSSLANRLIHHEFSTSSAKGVYVPEENCFIEDYSLDNISKVHGHYRNPVRRYRNSIFAPAHIIFKGRKKNLRHNLRAGRDSFLSIQVHPPFQREKRAQPCHFSQEIRILASQTLEVLRDKIICASDFQDVQGDLSDRPNTPVTFMTRDVYRSAMFYINNTFYIDERYTDYVDYSNVIRKWALGRGISVGPTLAMRDLAVGKLTLRFGYPYLYLHQGCCEHLIIVNDARLLTRRDSLIASDYPLMSGLHRLKPEYCISCLTKSARWIVTGSDRLLHDFTHMCDACFQLFNYKDGKKLGDFRAYRFFDPGSLL